MPDTPRDIKRQASEEGHFSKDGDIEVLDGVVHDAVFGEVDAKQGPNFRGVSAGGALALMAKANIGLGILQIPFVFMSIGIVPGIILLILIAILMIYTGAQIQPFKQLHPEIYSYADIGNLLFGKVGRVAFAIIFVLNFIFVTASAIVAVSTSLNAISVHAACTAIFIAVSAIAGWMCASIRTLGAISWLTWVGMVSILAAVLTMVVATGVQDRPFAAPAAPLPWHKDVQVFGKADFATGVGAITNVLYSFSATPTYFGIISEMRDQSQYKKVMIMATLLTCALYILLGTLVYHFCGQYVSSPALGSAGHLMKRVCYGLALPGLLVSLCLWSHLSAKYVFVSLLRNSEHLNRATFKHWAVWLSCTAGTVGVAYILASAIPNFGAIVGFIGSLFTPQTTILVFPLIWWHDYWRYTPREQRNYRTAAIQMFIFVCGLFFVVGGLYGAVKSLINMGKASSPWSCVDNSV